MEVVLVSTDAKVYDDFLKLELDLVKVANKSQVHSLEITKYVLIEMKRCYLDSFQNVAILNLSGNFLTSLENGIFHSLANLISINLSVNMLDIIDNNLFEINGQLKVIIFNNNLLTVINTAAMLPLVNLETLDLSHNLITEVFDNCLSCPALVKLKLNDNGIKKIHENAFVDIPNVTYLKLNNNRLSSLAKVNFLPLTKLHYLNLNDNSIRNFDKDILLNSNEVSTLYLSNNLLSNIKYYIMLGGMGNLIDLDLSKNNIPRITKPTFFQCLKLKYLNVTVTDFFEVSIIQYLKFLQSFQLFYNSERDIAFKRHFFEIFAKKCQLNTLKLTFKNVTFTKKLSFLRLKNLETLYLECTGISNKVYEIGLSEQLYKLPKLKNLTLKNLNCLYLLRCTISSFSNSSSIRHLNLTGIRNTLISNMFENMPNLVYLNLSYSNVTLIQKFAFRNLVRLETLIVEHSKLNSIEVHYFAYNSRLKVLNLSHCQINVIADYSFYNLHKLEVLDLSFNTLPIVTRNTFYGLPQNITLYVDV